MFAVGTYEDIVEYERQIEHMEIVVFLFVKPNDDNFSNIIQEFEYIHYNSDKYCSIYAIGYTDDPEKGNTAHYKKVTDVAGRDWFFSNKAYVEFKNHLETRIKWKYSGETELLILQNNPGKRDPLNFANYIAIDINKGLREGYLDSFQVFMENLVRNARKNVTAKELARDMVVSRIRLKEIVYNSIGESKKIPSPIKKILKDKLFYRSATSII